MAFIYKFQDKEGALCWQQSQITKPLVLIVWIEKIREFTEKFYC